MKRKWLKTTGMLFVVLVLAAGFSYVWLMKDTGDYVKTLGAERKSNVLKNISVDLPEAMNDAVPENTGKPAVSNTTASAAVAASTEPVQEEEPLIMNTPGIVYLLFLGTDRTLERDEYLGIYRTDTLCLAKIDLTEKKIQLLNIPRDTYTYLPVVKKKDRINAAYAYGSQKNKGVEATIEAVNHFLGVSVIDYYFLLEMDPIPKIVDSLGGVELDVEIDMKTHGANVSKGYQLLDGVKAFDYIHWRYSGMGDIDRIKRQQKFAKALYTKLQNEGSFVQAAELLMKYNRNIQTNMSPKQLISFARLISEITSEDISYSLIPGFSKTIDKKSVWMPEEGEMKSLLLEYFGSSIQG